MTRWPNQILARQEADRLYNAGVRRVCVTSPTGSGKTLMLTDAIDWALNEVGPVSLYTNRRMLLEQTQRFLQERGIHHGVRAAGYEQNPMADVQLCMTQSEGSQVLTRERRQLHPAKVVLVDEAHVQKGAVMETLLARHVEAGAFILGYTATPLGIGHLYDELVIAGTNSQMRDVGALVPAVTYGCDEPDLKHIKRYQVGEDLSTVDTVKAIMRPGIFGRVYDWWTKLNPDAKPALLFAPGVPESIWFAEQFVAKGVTAAHIDGDDIWLNGQSFKSSPEGRGDIMAGSKDGTIKVICNRFVLREGIDAPWIEHGILATVFGALSSFIQSGGRLLRASPSTGKERGLIQDHGGSWHRHGSLNADREWRLDYTNHIVASLRAERMRQRKDLEPICCPRCSALRLGGPKCPKCGHEHKTRSRLVVQIDGSLREMKGDIYRPRQVREHENTQALWDRCYFGARKSERSFAQAEAWFFQQHHYWPPRHLANMPTNDVDWYRSVRDVARETLTRRKESVA